PEIRTYSFTFLAIAKFDPKIFAKLKSIFYISYFCDTAIIFLRVNNCIVIIPTYNERENVADMIKAIFSLPVPFDLLIVDDNSPDGTGQIVKDLQVAIDKPPSHFNRQLHLLERKEKSGLGTAYIAGFKYALERNYEYIFEMDCDFSHNPHDLVR